MRASLPDRLRSALSWRYVFARNSIEFAAFRLYSRIRFGRSRWLDTETGRLFVRSDDYRSFVLARSLSPQRESRFIWKQLAALHPDLCVDVGANYGEFTAAIASMALPTIVVEPNAPLAECLRASFALHPWITVAEVALSDHDGEGKLHESPHYSGSASMFEPVASGSHKFFGHPRGTFASDVRVRRLDALVADLVRQPPRSLLLKIDVEGSEGRVLSGASTLLRQCRWWRAIVEWNPAAVRGSDLPAESAWRAYRAWPGLVVQASVTSEQIQSALGELPVTPPLKTCDVLLGSGPVVKGGQDVR